MALALPVTERYERGLQLRAGGLSVREAAEKVGVSKSALARRITGECSVAARNGPRRVLSDGEERAVVDCCVHLAAAGFGFRMQLLKEKVLQICADGREVPWGSDGPGRAWAEAFLQRWKGTLSIRSCRIYDSNRRAADDPEEAQQYFDRVEVVFNEHRFPASHI